MTDAERGWATTPDPVEGTVRFRIHGAVAEFLLHRPAKRNALTPTMLEALHDACRELARNDSVRVVVVRGAGSAFSAGADLGIFSELTPAEIGGAWTRSGQEAFAALAGLPAVTVAVLSGNALGGGYELALHCDLRVASVASSVGLPEVRLGTLPGWGGLDRLIELVGPSRARLLALTGRVIPATEAERHGLVDVLAQPEDLEAAVRQLVDELLTAAPTAQRLLKQRFAPNGVGGLLDSVTGAVATWSGESAEGVAAFRDRRAACWTYSWTAGPSEEEA